MNPKKVIPIARAEDVAAAGSSCEAKEPYVLMVLGDSMAPEFMEGDVIVIDPEGVARDGAYVIAWHNDEYIFRQLRIDKGEWQIVALDAHYPPQILSGPDAVKGVIIQKKTPGKRGSAKRY
jgi:phage repressor protein C with HTH and peptisase S24 domain